jgi:phosphoribosylaminoimidazole-succinocarboxamide synthase
LTNKSKNNSNLTVESVYKDLPFDEQKYTLIEYTDILFNKNKKTRIKDYGAKSASINAFFLDYLKQYHIPCAFLKHYKANILKFIKHRRLSFYVRMLNVSDKRIMKIFGKKEFDLLELPVFEFHYGIEKDSLISESHLTTFDLCTYDELKIINRICSKVNAVLKSFFERRNETLAEVNCFFGKADGKIYLVEDFTPESIKIIPMDMNKKSLNPYKLETHAQHRKYVDHLFNLMSS